MVVHKYIKMVSKKAQIQQMESTAVLFVLFFLIIIGLVFYNNVTNNKVDAMENRFSDLAAKQTIQKISSAPELSCTSNGITTLECFDIKKLIAFKNLINSNKDYYRHEYGNVKISLSLVYHPSSDKGVVPFCTMQTGVCEDELDFELFDFSKNISSGNYNARTFIYPVLLGDYRMVPERYYFGKIKISYYSKE